MSTRSFIGRKNANGTYHGSYCHSDGYLDHVGKVLLAHYQDPAKVDALVALGDLSSLAEEIGEKHDFDWLGEHFTANNGTDYHADPRYRMCQAYGRDRGEKDTEADLYGTLAEFLAAGAGCSNGYIYLFDGEQWVMFSPYIKGKPLEVADKYRTGEWKSCLLKDANDSEE